MEAAVLNKAHEIAEVIKVHQKTITLHIAGWIDLSLIDVLGDTSFVIWFNYCNFRCPWCQNAHVVNATVTKEVTIEEVIEAVEKSSKFLGYLHVTGGEPTLQAEGLEILFKKCKDELGVKTSVSTNGSKPEVINNLLENKLLDHIAIDVKAPLNNVKKYREIVGLTNVQHFEKTLEAIKNSIEAAIEKAEFIEFRTTFVPTLLSEDDIVEIAKNLKEEFNYEKRCKAAYILQQFIPRETLIDPNLIKLERTSIESLLRTAKRIKKEINLNEVYIRSQEVGTKKI